MNKEEKNQKGIFPIVIRIILVILYPFVIIATIGFLFLLSSIFLSQNIFSTFSNELKNIIMLVGISIALLPCWIAFSIFLIRPLIRNNHIYREETKKKELLPFQRNETSLKTETISESKQNNDSLKDLKTKNNYPAFPDTVPEIDKERDSIDGVYDDDYTYLKRWCEKSFEILTEDGQPNEESFYLNIASNIIKPIAKELLLLIERKSQKNRIDFNNNLYPFRDLLKLLGIVEYGSEMVGEKLQDVVTHYKGLLDDVTQIFLAEGFSRDSTSVMWGT